MNADAELADLISVVSYQNSAKKKGDLMKQKQFGIDFDPEASRSIRLLQFFFHFHFNDIELVMKEIASCQSSITFYLFFSVHQFNISSSMTFFKPRKRHSSLSAGDEPFFFFISMENIYDLAQIFLLCLLLDFVHI